MAKKRLFPLHPGPGYCVPDGFCIFCQNMFIEVEPVGFVKQKKGPTKYYHTRCQKGVNQDGGKTTPVLHRVSRSD